MIAVVAEFKIALTGAGNFRALAEQHAQRCLEREPGCQQFDITQDPAEPEQWLFYERYADEDALAAHRKTDYLPKFIEATQPYVLERKVRRFDVRIDTLKRPGLRLRASIPRTPCGSWSENTRP